MINNEAISVLLMSCGQYSRVFSSRRCDSVFLLCNSFYYNIFKARCAEQKTAKRKADS